MANESVDIVPAPEGPAGQKRRSVSVSSEGSSENEYEPRSKASKEEDSVSVHATDDDLAQLLAEPSVQAKVAD